MSDVNQYVNVMRQQGSQAAAVNPNSDTNQLQRELIEHYKNNKAKAQAILNGNPQKIFGSDVQRMHYQAADIAINGYPKPSINNSSIPSIANKESEMSKLNKAGWKPLSEKTETQILFG